MSLLSILMELITTVWERNSLNMAQLYSTGLFADANLSAYWRMEGNSNDSKGSNNGTDTAITYNVANGKFGQGGLFNGSTSKIVIADHSSLKPTTGITVGCWTKTTYTTGVAYYPSLAQNYFGTYGAVNLSGWRLSVDNAAVPQFSVAPNTGNTTVISPTHSTHIADGAWHFLVGTANGTHVKLYVDGALSATTTSSVLPVYAATTYPRIGCYNGAGSDVYNYNGSIDDIFLFSRALTLSEVQALYGNSGPLFFAQY